MMTMKRVDNQYIEFKGHAENPIVCSMVTYASVSLMKTITEFLEEPADYTITEGYFRLSLKGLTVGTQSFIDAFWYNMGELAKDYPNSFRIERIFAK